MASCITVCMWNLILPADQQTSAPPLPTSASTCLPRLQFWVLYKRTGHRVLLNKMGDLVVRPSYVETAIRGVPGGAGVLGRP
jgi:hypothetical protein